MDFISPKTDFAFKKIFGSTESKDILISFLNAILYEGQPTILDLEILDPYLGAQLKGVKDTYLDVKARINDGRIVIIEMQVLNVQAFGKRVLYNAAKTYSLQLTPGERYPGLRQVIAVNIIDFEMFENQTEVILRFVFKEKNHLFDYPNNDLELVFVELPKFRKELSELETLTDKWIYFLKHTGNLKTVPETMGIVPELQKAFEIAKAANLSREEFDTIQQQVFFIEDQRGAITLAVEQATKAGQLGLIMRLLVRRLGSVELDLQNRIRQLPLERLENLGEAVLDFTSTQDLIAWLDHVRLNPHN